MAAPYDAIGDPKPSIWLMTISWEKTIREDGNEHLPAKAETLSVLYLPHMGKYKTADIVGCADKPCKCHVKQVFGVVIWLG